MIANKYKQIENKGQDILHQRLFAKRLNTHSTAMQYIVIIKLTSAKNWRLHFRVCLSIARLLIKLRTDLDDFFWRSGSMIW